MKPPKPRKENAPAANGRASTVALRVRGYRPLGEGQIESYMPPCLPELFPLTSDQQAMLVVWIYGEKFADHSRERQRNGARFGRQRDGGTTAEDIAGFAKVSTSKAVAALRVARYLPEAVKAVIAGWKRLADLRAKVQNRKAQDAEGAAV